jgi:hypothetical protein
LGKTITLQFLGRWMCSKMLLFPFINSLLWACCTGFVAGINSIQTLAVHLGGSAYIELIFFLRQPEVMRVLVSTKDIHHANNDS